MRRTRDMAVSPRMKVGCGPAEGAPSRRGGELFQQAMRCLPRLKESMNVLRCQRTPQGFFTFFALSAFASFASSFGDSCCTLPTSFPVSASTFTSSMPLFPAVLKSNE